MEIGAIQRAGLTCDASGPIASLDARFGKVWYRFSGEGGSNPIAEAQYRLQLAVARFKSGQWAGLGRFDMDRLREAGMIDAAGVPGHHAIWSDIDAERLDHWRQGLSDQQVRDFQTRSRETLWRGHSFNAATQLSPMNLVPLSRADTSEARRVGQVCVSTRRSRGSKHH